MATFAEQFGYSFDEKVDRQERNTLKKQGLFGRITKKIRDCTKSVFEHPRKSLTVATGVAVSVFTPSCADDTEHKMPDNIIVAPRATFVTKSPNDFQCNSKKYATALETQKKAEPIQPSKLLQAWKQEKKLTSSVNPNVKAGKIETEEVLFDLSIYPKGSFVNFKNGYYFVINSTKNSLVLKDINVAEGAPFIKLQASNNPEIQPAYVQDILVSLKSHIAKFGENATEIAHKLGLEKWQENLIFSGKKIYASDRKIDANRRLYALPDANLVKTLFDQFQNYLAQFQPGDRYIFSPKDAQALECEILKVEAGNLYIRSEYKGKKVKFLIKPEDWQKVDLQKVAVTDPNQEFMPETPQEFEEKPEKRLNLVNLTEKTLEKLMKTLTQEIDGSAYKAEKEIFEIKISETTILSFLEKDANLTKILALGYFPEISHKTEITPLQKKFMAKWMLKILKNVKRFTDQVQIEPQVAEKAKALPGKNPAIGYLTKVFVSENSGDLKSEKIFFPCDGGMSWGPAQMQKTYVNSSLQALRAIEGNGLSEVYNNLKFDELENAYATYQAKISQINALSLGQTQKKEQIQIAKIAYIKLIREINSPIIFNSSVISNLILANAINVHRRIDKVEAGLATTKLATVRLTIEEKAVLEEIEYQMGSRIFDRRYKGKVVKMGMLKRYLYAKRKNPELEIFDWLKQIGVRKNAIKALQRKNSARLLQQEVEEFNVQARFYQMQTMYKNHNAQAGVAENKFVTTSSFKKTPKNMQIVENHKGDLALLKALLAKSKTGISENSIQKFIKMIAAGLVYNEDLSVADVLNQYVEKYEKKMFTKNADSVLLENLKQLRAKLIKHSKGPSKHVIETASISSKNKIDMPGQIIIANFTQGIKNRMHGFTDGLLSVA